MITFVLYLKSITFKIDNQPVPNKSRILICSVFHSSRSFLKLVLLFLYYLSCNTFIHNYRIFFGFRFLVFLKISSSCCQSRILQTMVLGCDDCWSVVVVVVVTYPLIWV